MLETTFTLKICNLTCRIYLNSVKMNIYQQIVMVYNQFLTDIRLEIITRLFFFLLQDYGVEFLE